MPRYVLKKKYMRAKEMIEGCWYKNKFIPVGGALRQHDDGVLSGRAARSVEDFEMR